MSDKRFPGVTGNPWMSSSSEAIRYNENHDEHGQFASGSGGGGGSSKYGAHGPFEHSVRPSSSSDKYGASQSAGRSIQEAHAHVNGKALPVSPNDSITGVNTEGKTVSGKVYGGSGKSGTMHYDVEDKNGQMHTVSADKITSVDRLTYVNDRLKSAVSL